MCEIGALVGVDMDRIFCLFVFFLLSRLFTMKEINKTEIACLL